MGKIFKFTDQNRVAFLNVVVDKRNRIRLRGIKRNGKRYYYFTEIKVKNFREGKIQYNVLNMEKREI